MKYNKIASIIPTLQFSPPQRLHFASISPQIFTLPYCKGSIKHQNIQASKTGKEEHGRTQENTQNPPNPVPPHAHMHAGEHAAHFALFFSTHSAHTMPVPMWDQYSICLPKRSCGTCPVNSVFARCKHQEKKTHLRSQSNPSLPGVPSLT